MRSRDRSSRLYARAITTLGSFACFVAACGTPNPTGDAGDAADALDASDSADVQPADTGPDAPTGPIRLTFATTPGTGFFDRPFPLQTRVDAMGHPDLTGYPNPRRLMVVDSLIEFANRAPDGFSTAGAVYFLFNGPLRAAGFPSDGAASTQDASNVFLVDVDPASPERGQRRPVWVAQTVARDSYRPIYLLQVMPMPGYNLREHTTYAVVVRAAVGTGDATRPLEVDPTLREVLAGRVPAGVADGARLNDAYAPLRTWLGERMIAPDSIVAATVFRTADVTTQLRTAVDHVATLPPPAPSAPFTRVRMMPEYCAYASTWEAPQFQNGTPPYSTTGGVMQFDTAGHPVQQRTERVPFVVAVPRRVMPRDGFPLVLNVHGTGGNSMQIVDRGTMPSPMQPAPQGTGTAMHYARRGWGSASMGGPLQPERAGSASMSGLAMYNFFNAPSMRDNFYQSILEHVIFRRVVLSLRLDVSDCPGADVSAATDGRARFDVGHMVVMGQSLGSYLSGMLAALDTGWLGAILTGAGGSWTQFVFDTPEYGLQNLLERAVLLLPMTERLDPFHPVINAFNLGSGAADNTNYADNVLREPYPMHTAPHVLVIEGDQDTQVGPGLQRALMAALRPDFVGADVGPAQDQILASVLAVGRMQRMPPVSMNVMTPSGLRTAGVVRYAPEAMNRGHYVSFQIPEAIRQYACFLDTLGRTGTPTIVSGNDPAAPCN